MKCVGYWGTWAAYRQGDGKFEFSNIDPNIFTHLIYTFFGITVDGDITYLDSWLDIDRGFIDGFIALKSVNPNCKMMASVGGWNCEPATFSQLAANPASRTAFAQNTLAFLQKHGFDGFDIGKLFFPILKRNNSSRVSFSDWEYPVNRMTAITAPEDKQNFVLLLQEMKNALSPAGLALTIAVGATSKQGDISYDVPGIVPSVDFINLMTYDLHGSWDGATGINAPLYAGPDANNQLNVDACVQYWTSQGCPKDKLIVGIPTYGRTFALQDSGQNGVNAPSSGPGDAGPWTATAGFLGYNEILVNGWPESWQDDQKVPYAFSGNQWVGYDNKQSVTEKANYIVSNGLGGCMFWSIETDDFRNGYPLVKTAFDIVKSRRSHALTQRYPTPMRNNPFIKVTMPKEKQRDPIAKLQHSIQTVVVKERNFFFVFFMAMLLLCVAFSCFLIMS